MGRWLSFCSSEELDHQQRNTPPFGSGALRRCQGRFSTALFLVAVIALLLSAALIGHFTAGPSTSFLLAGGGGGANPVGADLGEAHLQDAFRSEIQRAPTALLPDNSPRYPAVVTTIPVGSGPLGVAYDAATGQVFVANGGSSNVSVISDVTDTVVATIPVGFEPQAVAYDAETGQVFVTTIGYSNVSVISDRTDRVVATVQVGSYPDGAAYDAARDEVFVTNTASTYVSVISGATDKVVAKVPVGDFGPMGVTYDSAKAEVFVTNVEADNVSVINDTTDKVVANVPVGALPYGAAYDVASDQVFVTNYGCDPCSDNVSVISGTTDKVVATVKVGYGPNGVAYDPATSQMFVTNTGSTEPKYSQDDVSVISDTNDAVVATVPVGSEPSGVAYDAAKGEAFVTNTGSNNVSVISDGSVPPAYPVRFTTSPTTCGSITFNGTTYTNGQSVLAVAGSYVVSATACAGYTLQNLSGTGSVSVGSGKATANGTGGITATFSSNPSSSAAGFLGLPGNDGYYVLGGVAAVVVAAIVALVLVRRTRTKPTASSGPATERPCPACGATNLRDSAFCESCGKPLPSLP